jgi:hypothetical protein
VLTWFSEIQNQKEADVIATDKVCLPNYLMIHFLGDQTGYRTRNRKRETQTENRVDQQLVSKTKQVRGRF